MSRVRQSYTAKEKLDVVKYAETHDYRDAGRDHSRRPRKNDKDNNGPSQGHPYSRENSLNNCQKYSPTPAYSVPKQLYPCLLCDIQIYR
ncbi:hypothetical protein DPMN_104816 [Dreissena polymorpha]|uniref:Transposase n=1 Tax=Dreissena polymorpha TaxID=45954 RepID=A0A9D4K1E8_DREPO|nr:hypothetical protein DPMN_104816 [Dreissena polymorpha]